MLVEGLGAVGVAPGLDDVLDLVGLEGVLDALLDGLGHAQDLQGRDPPLAPLPGEQALAHGGFEVLSQADAHHVLLAGGEDANQPPHGLGGVGGVHRAKDQVAGLGCLEGDVDGLGVPHLPQEDDVGVLAQGRPQGTVEGPGIEADLALAHRSPLVLVDELDGVLDGEDVGALLLVDVVDHGRQGRGLAAPRHPGDEHQAPLLGGDLLEHRRQAEGLEGGDLEGDDPQDHREGVALPVDVDAKPPDPVDAVGPVPLLDPVHRHRGLGAGDDDRDHRRGVIPPEDRPLHLLEHPVYPQQDRGVDLQVDVAGVGLHGGGQYPVEGGGIHGDLRSAQWKGAWRGERSCPNQPGIDACSCTARQAGQ